MKIMKSRKKVLIVKLDCISYWFYNFIRVQQINLFSKRLNQKILKTRLHKICKKANDVIWIIIPNDSRHKAVDSVLKFKYMSRSLAKLTKAIFTALYFPTDKSMKVMDSLAVRSVQILNTGSSPRVKSFFFG